MKIRTQFIITLSLFGLLLVAIAGSLVNTNQKVERLNKQEEIAKSIEHIARELSYLSNDYLLHNESQQRARWEAKYSSLSENLENLVPNTPEQQVLVAQIRANLGRLEAVFYDITSTLESFSQTPGSGPDLEFIQISWSRIEVQNQGMIFDASLLAQQFRDQANQLNQTNIMLIFILVGIFVAYIVTNYLLVYQHILRSLSVLQAGARMVGTGDLSYTIEPVQNDEIGDVSRAFNNMTSSLREITASKIDLEKEISERKQAELALAQVNRALRTHTEELQRSNQALEDFALIASHDLREPLRKIRIFGERLLSLDTQGLDDDGRDFIHRMQRSAVRMELMLEGLLAYSRASTHNQQFSEVDLRKIATEVVSDLEISITQSDGRVEIDDLPVIKADTVQMRQLLQNLVGNGLKFHKPGIPPVVKVYARIYQGDLNTAEVVNSDHAHRSTAQVEIVVEDNGIGFEMENADRLFKPFHRLVGKSAYEGSGMGLAICQKIVERHNGTIAAQSVPGKGSTFTVLLPCE
jgi:signal transduction histidine kinase